MDKDDFEQWFLRELQQRAGRRFINGREQVWKIVITYLKQHWAGFNNLTDANLFELKRTLFEVGVQTSATLGFVILEDVEKRLKHWGWSLKEIRDFPGWAYRVARIKNLIETGAVPDFAKMLIVARSHPLTEAEKQAIQIARNVTMQDLEPVFDATGKLVEGDVLQKEKERLRRVVVEALEQRKHPLTVAREMYKLERAEGIYRDFEQIATTELASAFALGSFKADRISGKFRDKDLIYRIPRPQAGKICITLFTSRDGTPRLYCVEDLECGTTPLINVGDGAQTHHRAVILPMKIASAHPGSNIMAS